MRPGGEGGRSLRNLASHGDASEAARGRQAVREDRWCGVGLWGLGTNQRLATNATGCEPQAAAGSANDHTGPRVPVAHLVQPIAPSANALSRSGWDQSDRQGVP